MSVLHLIALAFLLFFLTFGYLVPFVHQHVVKERNIAVAILLIGLLIASILIGGIFLLLAV